MKLKNLLSIPKYLSSINKFTERTHNCGQLTNSDVGKDVTLFGWVKFTRFDNKIIALRDSYGSTQCILPETLRAIQISNESVIKVSGVVKYRPERQQNNKLETGQIEVHANSIDLLSKAKKDLPILSRDPSVHSLENRLKYRYLDLRGDPMQQALRFRSNICKILRDKLHGLNFVECETPTLFNKTPGGAREFVVPSREPDKFYNLVQSPQQLKQLLMIGGLDRYYQICRCYRDEPGRSDRQPEFTQLDIELSFTNQNLVMNLVDELVYDLIVNLTKEDERDSAMTSFDENRRIRRMSFSEAFEKYGTDKPDLRVGCTIESHEEALKIQFPHVIDDELIETTKVVTNNNLPVICCIDRGKSIVEVADKSDEARKLLGSIRSSAIGRMKDEDRSEKLAFLWITDFPLFCRDNDGNLESNHHPFTAPTDDTVHLLATDPLSVIGQHYDLVLNGQEIAGGSIRIHDHVLQSQIFSDVLRLDEGIFDYFIEALKSGCPPHGGIAFGLDRLVATLAEKDSIRDVIAFPKTSTGRDMLTGSPHNL